MSDVKRKLKSLYEEAFRKHPNDPRAVAVEVRARIDAEPGDERAALDRELKLLLGFDEERPKYEH